MYKVGIKTHLLIGKLFFDSYFKCIPPISLTVRGLSQNESRKKRIAIIGAGCSGLPAIKSCLEEGFQPVCFEKSDNVGGIWHQTGAQTEKGTVMKSVVVNNSKELMCYSDFPMPASFPNFPHRDEMQQYFEVFSEKFDLKQHIKFNNEVLKIEESDDYEKSGRWKVRVRNWNKGLEEMERFDGVMLCTGLYNYTYMPGFPGMNRFQGKIIHSNDVKSVEEFQGKRVLVVGLGNSGGDIAVEISRVASKTFISTRSGSYVIRRITEGGLPFDIPAFTRYSMWRAKLLPWGLNDTLLEYRVQKWFNHAAYGLQPKYRISQVASIVNDELPNRIMYGDIIIHDDVTSFTPRGAIFKDGGKIDNIDVVVMATGFEFRYPFLDKSIIEIKNNKVDLYKHIFPPDHSHHTLAAIGLVQPRGPYPLTSECQSRWAVKVFKGTHKLPSRDQMWKDIKAKDAINRKRYQDSMRYELRVDWIPYCDELAKDIGFKPNLGKIALSDPILAWKVFFGPCLPAQYRLVGPGMWLGARDVVLNVLERVLPINKKEVLNDNMQQNIQTQNDERIASANFGRQFLLVSSRAGVSKTGTK